MDKYNILEGLLIFFSIVFKYLIVYGVSNNILYMYLVVLVIMVCIDIYNKKLKKQEMRKIIFFFIISAFFVIMYKDVNFLISFLLSLIIVNKSKDDFIKIFFKSSLFMFILTIIMYKLEIVKSHDLIRISNDGILKTRYSLGFNHPNEVFLFYLPISLAGYFLYGNKKTYYLILLITSTILYKLSDCRTGYFIVFLIILLDMFKKLLHNNTIKKILPHFMIICTILSILIAWKYGNDLDGGVSRLLSGRPYYWNVYMKSGKLISLFGKNKIDGYNLDNFYIYVLVELGSVGYLIYAYIYYKSLKILKLDIKYTIILIIFFIYGMTEANTIIGSIQFLFAIQIASLITYTKEKKKIDEGQ